MDKRGMASTVMTVLLLLTFEQYATPVAFVSASTCRNPGQSMILKLFSSCFARRILIELEKDSSKLRQ